jgi:outer membrane protein assembly factor BamB
MAIDINTKELIWEHYLPTNCHRVNAPLCVAGDFLYLSAWGYFTSYNRLFALNRNTGEEVWNYDTGEWYDGWYPAAVVYNDIVYFPDGNSLNALNAQTGEVLWQFDVYGISHSAPAVDPETQSIFLTAYENANTFKVWYLDLATGEIKWQYQLRRDCSYPLVVSGNKVFVTDEYVSGQTYADYLAFDTSSGVLLWTYTRLVNTGVFPPVVNEAENLIYVADVADLAPSARITALNMDTKEVVWSHLERGDCWFSPILINNQLFMPCWSDKIKVFNALNGQFLREYNAIGPYDLQEIIAADSKLIASYDASFPDLDLIVCYQQKDKGADQIHFMEPDIE